MTADLICIGNAIVDVITSCQDALISDEGMVKGDMNLIDADRALHLYDLMGKRTEKSGGSAANTAVAAAQLGCRSAFIGKVQDDPLGATYVSDILSVGVSYPVAKSRRGAPTGRSMIFVTPDGERTMNTYLGAAVELTPQDLPVAAIEQAKLAYLEGYLFDSPTAKQACIDTAKICKAAGGTTALAISAFFIADAHRVGFHSMMADGLIDILFANEEEARIFAQAGEDLDAALDHLARHASVAVVTTADKGSIVLKDGQRIVVGTPQVSQVVDATGAGDAYAGGFLAAYLAGKSLADCAAQGSDLAAKVIQQIGPRLV